MNLLRTKSFWTRFLVSILLCALIIPAYFLWDGIYLRYLLVFAIIVAIIETAVIFAGSRFVPVKASEVLSTFLLIFCEFMAIIDITRTTREFLGGMIFICACTDVSAYLGGSIIGGKIIHHRPFPNVSPKKSYEGLFYGLFGGCLSAILWYMKVLEPLDAGFTIWQLLLIVPVAILGDLNESYFKRIYDVKDSNDFLIDTPIFGLIEKPLGGRSGHGGYLDRLDSLLLVLSVELFISLVS